MPTYVSLDPETYGEGTVFEAADDDAAIRQTRADLRAIVGGDDGPNAEFRHVLYRCVPDADLAEFQPAHERDVGSNWYELALESGDYLVLDQSRVFEQITEVVVVCKSKDTIEWDAEEVEREEVEWEARQAAEAEDRHSMADWMR